MIGIRVFKGLLSLLLRIFKVLLLFGGMIIGFVFILLLMRIMVRMMLVFRLGRIIRFGVILWDVMLKVSG